MTIDESKLPTVMPSSVARTTPDGKPTRFLIDWEETTRNWYLTNAVDLDQRIATVQSQTDGNAAAITQEAIARTDADDALAVQIDTVEAKTNAATANGEIYFAAAATPAGATAAYGLYLTAGRAFTGFEMIAKSDGTSAIMFNANQFALNDSGSATNVFNYSGGVFTFNVPVRIGTTDIATRAVNAPVAVSSGSTLQYGAPVDWTPILSLSGTGVTNGIAVLDLNFEYMKYQPIGYAVIGGQWRLRRSDGHIAGSGTLQNVADFFPVSRRFLDTGFQRSYTYSLEIRTYISSGSGAGAYFEFSTRSLMIDVRKR